MPLPFETVREELLRAGIAPRHASRYVTELREHLADLTARERASGLGDRQAADRALTLMGTDAVLTQAMIDKGIPRSLAARAPWATFAMVPIVLFAAVLCVTALSMMHLLSPVAGLAPSDMSQSYVELIALVSFVVNYVVGPLLAAVCIAVALRQRLASRWMWVGLALIAVLSALLGFHMSVIAPEGGHRGGAVFSLAGIVYRHGRANVGATLGVAGLHAAVLFVVAAAAYRVLWKRLIPAA
jgi:hypothetical protein